MVKKKKNSSRRSKYIILLSLSVIHMIKLKTQARVMPHNITQLQTKFLITEKRLTSCTR